MDFSKADTSGCSGDVLSHIPAVLGPLLLPQGDLAWLISDQ